MSGEHGPIYETIDQCDPDEWDEIVRAGLAGILMSHRFVSAVEQGFEDQARFMHMILHDDGRAVACGSFCVFPIDLNMLAEGFARRITEILSKRVPSMMRKKVVFCGLPVSVGAKHLAIAPGARSEGILRSMHEIAVSLARRERAPLRRLQGVCGQGSPEDWISWKSSGTSVSRHPRCTSSVAGSTVWTRTSPPCGAGTVNVSASRWTSLVPPTLRYERITDTAAILRLYTPALHRYYEAVALSSTHRLELLPLSFFHCLAQRLPGQVGLTLIYDGDRIAAFNWNLLHDADLSSSLRGPGL